MFCNSWWGDDFEGDDPFNENNERNFDNTDMELYNCAGFALNTYSWYIPCNYEEGDYSVFDFDPDDRYFNTVTLNVLTFEYVSRILNDFGSEIRLIHTLEEVEKDEYAIAFRLGNDDFHFFKQIDENKWAEKRGAEPVIRYLNTASVFEDDWCNGRYYGPIILMAKKRSE